MAVGAIVARILTQYSDKGSKAAQKDIAKLGKSFDNFAGNAKRAFGLATAASAAFAIKVGTDAVQAAISDQKSQVLLANSLRNTTNATDGAIAGTETYITAMQKQFNVADDELRPAMARLAATTGSVSAAQSLMQTSLDVSAQSGADLATSVGAIIKATRGQYKALANLVPGLDNATLATKDFGKITDKVSQITQGAAAKRAQTLEYRLIGLKIAYGEVLETLGYALLPVLERFVNIVSKQVLPQLEAWIALNKDKLAKSFQTATDFFIKMLAVAISFTNWASNNMGTLKALAILFATMWATSKVYAFATAIGAVTKAITGLNLAVGFGVLGPLTKAGAKGGMFATLGVALAGGNYANQLGGNIAGLIPGTKANKAKNAASIFSNPKYSPMSPGASDVAAGIKGTVGTVPAATSALQSFIDALNAANKSTKTAKTLQDKINAEAVRQNLARQAKLSGSSTIAIGGAGSLSYGNKGTNVVVNVAGSVSTQEDLVTSIVNGIERTTRRSFGTVGAFDRVAIL
jgi:hypothetical protein